MRERHRRTTRVTNTPIVCTVVRYYDIRFKRDQDSSGIDNMTSHADIKQSLVQINVIALRKNTIEMNLFKDKLRKMLIVISSNLARKSFSFVRSKLVYPQPEIMQS